MEETAGNGGGEMTLDLKKINACNEAVEWVEANPTLSPAQLWRQCPRGDWLLWIAANTNIDRKKLVLAACQCARLALRYMPEGETRPLVAIETAEAWCRGNATLQQVRDAAADATATAYAYATTDDAYAATAYAYGAAYDAANATDAAYAYAAATYAAYAYGAAYDAAYDAAYAYGADAAYAYDVREKTLRKCATIVRRHIGWREVLEGLENG